MRRHGRWVFTGLAAFLGAAAAARAGAPRPPAAPAPANSAPSVRLVPGVGSYDGEQLRFEPGSAGCAGTSFHATFTAEADGTAALAALVPALGGLPEGSVAAFTPPSAPLEPGERRTFDAVLTLPPALAAGHYLATLALEDAATGARAGAPASFDRCPAPPLSGIVLNDGHEVVFAASETGCAGTRFAANIKVAAIGTAPLEGVHLALDGFPPGTSASFSPASLRLVPGHPASVAATLTLPEALPAGLYTGIVSAADAATGTSASTAASVTRCAAPRPGLTIIADGGSEVVFAAGSGGCSGTGYSTHFIVEATGHLPLADVRPRVAGFPAGTTVRFSPESARLAPGQRAEFRATLTVPPALDPGRYEAVLSAADAGTGSSDSARASFIRCEVLTPGLRIWLEDDETALLLLPGAGGCAGGAFEGRFAVEASGRSFGEVVPSLTGLPPGVSVSFSPARARLRPGEKLGFRASLAVPATLAAGSYSATLRAADAASRAHDEKPARFERCAPGRPGVRIVLPEGETVARFAPGSSGCSGTSFHAAVAIEATGDVALAAVTPRVSGFPPGVSVSFVPSSLALAPGARASFEATITAATPLAPGTYPGTLEVRDEASGASDAATAVFERCPAAAAGLRIVVEPGPDVVLAPASGCAGDVFAARVWVEDAGATALGSVALSVAGFPAATSLRVTPARVSLEPGERKSFELGLSGAAALAPGSYVAAVMARDAATGAADSAMARLERCDHPGDGGGPGDDPGDPGDHGPALLTLAQKASKGSVRVGEVLTYTLTLANAGASAIHDLTVEESLPAGFTHVRGRTAIDGRAADDPLPGPPLSWRIPRLDPGDETVLAFQAVVGSGVGTGTAVARARVVSARASAGPAEASVEVTRRALPSFGHLRGVVRYRGGSGVAGVRLLLDSDRELTSGEDGRFTFEGIVGGEHVVALDARSLKPGDRVIGDDFRQLFLFDGAGESVEFLLAPRPVLGLKLDRLAVETKEVGKGE